MGKLQDMTVGEFISLMVDVAAKLPDSADELEIPPTLDQRETRTEEAAPEDEKPKRGRRGRKPKAEEAAPETSPEDEKPKRGRRGRKPKAEEAAPETSPEASLKTPPAITDADLSKAASQAAAALGEVGVATVKEVLSEFAVTKVSQIPHETRQEFLDTVKALLEDDSAGEEDAPW